MNLTRRARAVHSGGAILAGVVRPALREKLIASGLLAAVLSLAYAPMFLGRIVYLRDLGRWAWPARAFVRDAVMSGQAPVWNPDQGLGFSVPADPLYGLFYPPNLVLLVCPLSAGLTWFWFMHLLFGAVGLATLARRFRASPIGASVGGVAWALSGFTTSEWTSGLRMPASAWIPWCAVGFIAMLRAVDDRERPLARGVAAAAAPVAFALLFGEVFFAIMAVGFGLTAALVWWTAVSDEAAPPRQVGRAVAVTSLALALGAGLGAASWLPATRAAAITERGHAFPRELAEAWSLEPVRLPELVADVRMVTMFERDPTAVLEVLGGAPLAFGLYLGGSVLALGVAALGRRRHVSWALAGMSLVSFLLALGRYTPLHGIIRVLVPPLAFMRSPVKYLTLTVMSLALLASLGATRVGEDKRPRWPRTAVLCALLLLLAAASRAAPRVFADELRSGAIHSAIGASAVLGAQLLAPCRQRLAAPALLAAIGLDLGTAAWPLHRFGPAAILSEPPPMALAIRADAASRGLPVHPRLYRGSRVQSSILRFRDPAVQLPAVTLNDNTAGPFGIANVPGYDSAISPTFTRLVAEGRHSNVALMRLLAIDYALLSVNDPTAAETRTGFTPLLDPLPGARLYRVDNVLPRVYLAGAAVVLDDEAARTTLFQPDVVGGGQVVLAPGDGAAPLSGPPERAGECRMEDFRTDRVVVTCAATRPAIAVIVEQHDPGWRATVDGAPAPLLRANTVLRAVALSPGAHRVVLEFHPPGLAGGLALSGAALVAFIACLALGRRSASRQPV